MLGGGPAGCAAARLLALWGHEVRLITKPSAPQAALAESVPPSTRKLFAVLGLERAMDEEGFVRSTGHTVWWGGEARVEPFPAGARGWQVTHDRLARLLRRAAAEAGVRVEERLLAAADIGGEGAGLTLDCTGRAGVVARARGWRVPEPGVRTVALVGVWRPGPAFQVPDATHTLIESYAAGWAWSVPDLTGDRHVAVMIDPRTSGLASGTARAIYETEIRKTSRLASLLSDAVLVGGPHGWDASTYSAARYADDDLMLVGDAGSFVDPVSSAGIKKALASGWLAAVASHTALLRPELRSAALAFFETREREIFSRLRGLTRTQFRGGAPDAGQPFWSDRSGAPDDDPADDASVRAAFDRLRAAPALAFTRGETVTLDLRPAVSGSEIVLERRLVTPDLPHGVRYVRDVDVVAIVELGPAATDVPELFEAYCRRAGPVALPDFLAALATAVARRWLVAGDRPTAGA